MAETFGQRLRRLREARGMTVAEVARRVSLVPIPGARVTATALRRFEDRAAADIDFEVGLGLAFVFNIRVRYLVDGSGAEGKFDGDRVAS